MSTRKQRKQPKATLPIGTRVVLKGLKGAAQYNGMKATIVGAFDSEKGRYPIKIRKLGKHLAIKPVNMDVVEKKVKKKTPETCDIEDIDGGGWILVRQVKAGRSWHPAKDHLTGTAEYDNGDGTFSIRFDNDTFDEFLFATGDGKKWLIADKEQVIGEWYSNGSRTIKKSSKQNSIHQARWYRRKMCAEDPWISLTDHMTADRNGDMLYGGSSDGEHAKALSEHDGARVYIRDSRASPSTRKKKKKKNIPIEKTFDSKTRVLDYSLERYGKEDATAIASLLKHDSTVTEINMNYCKIGHVGAHAISASLKANSTLQKIKLNGASIGDYGAKSLAEALKENKILTWLDISYNAIGDEGAIAFMTAMEMNISLTCLLLCGNKISDAGFQTIGKSLDKNRSLKKLDLSSSIYQIGELGDLGAISIADALKVNSVLEELHLYFHKISDKGAQAFGKCLKINSSLTKLDLSQNRIQDVGAQSIAQAMKINSALKILYLTNNNIKNSGCKAIVEGLKKNKTLHTLYLNDNDISHKIKKSFEATINNHSTISSFMI